MLRTGVDLIEIARIRTAIVRHGEHFLQRVFTVNELIHCQGRVESLAGRFAAKEAVGKALGTGIWRNGIVWTDIETLRDPQSGAPLLHLHNAAADHAAALGLHEWSLSLSHDRQRVVAFVVAVGL
jgi:holo-[acyl-carrier protein] synthase